MCATQIIGPVITHVSCYCWLVAVLYFAMLESVKVKNFKCHTETTILKVLFGIQEDLTTLKIEA
jgi:hypothetical protein